MNPLSLPPSGFTCYISYSRSDGHAYAERLSEHLRARGLVILSPESSTSAGEAWAHSIRVAVDQADVLILIATPKALQSKWVLEESAHFHGRARPLLVILFDHAYQELPEFIFELGGMVEKESAIHEGPTAHVLASLAHELTLLAAKPRSSGHAPQRPPKRPREHRPLNEGKLILVGRGEVGKTSLVKRLAHDDFDGNESKTQGINITKWSLPDGADTLRLNIWDFGGQEIMHATHQFFLTERSLYLLVLNGREGGEDADADYWLKHIESFGGDSPVVVVQNKISQHPFELNYRGLQSRYPQIRRFIKTDCKERLGVLDLRETISNVINSMPEVRMQFPADWFAVKERLETMEEEFIGYRGFVDLCTEEGIADDGDRETLAFVLHCLGIALHYRDDSRLRETSVLKPEWVTHGIYNILNATKLAERHGELRLSDLLTLLPENRYPVDRHFFLLELMRKFSLCFPFRDEADRYLVPDLLGKEEPAEVAAFQPKVCLNFEYRYGILPEGLLPRFIVRTHLLSRGQERWRSGVVLAYEDCKALVRAETAERRVVARVMGGSAGARRNLLAIIRYDLERIHSEFKDRLDAQAKVPLEAFPEFAIDYKKLVAFERQGVKNFPEFIGREVISVHVDDLLNGIDFKEERADTLDTLNRAKSVFFSYSHKDESLRDELEVHLKLLQRQRIISTWHDRKIPAGSDWDRDIDNRLERASIILLLTSADFLASDYCWEKEVRRALERHAAKEATVIPILLRSCDWKSAPFANLQGLPRDMTAVTAWPDRDAAWTDVALGIRRVAESQ